MAEFAKPPRDRKAKDEDLPASRNASPQPTSEKKQEQQEEKEDREDSRENRRRLALIALVTFLMSCAGKMHGPVLTQYVYQIYTNQVYGNASQGVHISSKPCVNASSAEGLNSSDDTDPRRQEVWSCCCCCCINVPAEVHPIWDNMVVLLLLLY